MAYKIQKQQNITEELELYNEQGERVATIEVRLDRDGLAEKLSAKHVALIRAYQNLVELQKKSKSGNSIDYDKALEETGQAVIDMFEAVFGKADSDTIREFYGNNTLQMCREVLPFITDVVLPAVRKLGQLKRKKSVDSYKKKRFF